ncbi:MAG: hypothetical protein GC204_19435 [Chloroflexi bacterium]|nr:hypothetical protein [Chloroflexota bacterium]
MFDDDDAQSDEPYIYPIEYDDFDAPQPYWTRHRIILTVFVILIVVTLLAYTLQGFFLPHQPPLPIQPGPMI